jgi:hypothetical protein
MLAKIAGSVLAPNAWRGELKSQSRTIRATLLLDRDNDAAAPHVRARGSELAPTNGASRSRLKTSALQFALDDIVSYLKRDHGKRRPTDDRGSR